MVVFFQEEFSVRGDDRFLHFKIATVARNKKRRLSRKKRFNLG